MLLTAVGVAIMWTSDSTADDPGSFRADKVGKLCDSVDTSPFEKLTPKVESTDVKAKPKAVPALFGCELRLLQDKESSDYLAITLNVEARVSNTVADAEEGFAGAVDYEKSKGRKVTKPKGVGDEAAAVTVSTEVEQQECRAHIRSSNAVLSVTMFVTGSGLECGESPDDLLKVGEATLGVMGSE